MMAYLITFAIGAVYTLCGIYLASLVADMPGSKVREFIGTSVPRSLLLIFLWPLSLSLAVAYKLKKVPP